MIEIPIPAGPHSELSISLDGVTYTFAFRWSSRTQSWTFDIGAADGTLIAGGMALVAGYPLLERFGRRSDLPSGALLLFDSEMQSADPGFTDLTTRHALIYLSAEEIASL